MDEAVKATLKAVIRSTIVLAIFIVFIKVFHPIWYVLFIGIMAFQLLVAVWNYHTRGEFSWKGVLQSWLTTLVLAALFSFIYQFGWLGFWLDVILTTTFLLVFKWKDYIKGVEAVETKIYGHPSSWYKKNKLPLPKVKVKL